MFTHLVNPLNRLGRVCFHQVHLLCVQQIKERQTGKKGGERPQDDREDNKCVIK